MKPSFDMAALVAATVSGGFLYVNPEAVKEYVDNGFVMLNMGIVNPENAAEFAAKATESGIASMSQPTEQPNPAAANAAAPAFEIVTGAALTVERTRQSKGSKYPFDQLPAPTTNEAGQKITARFFVPATEKSPEPWRTLNSTVSAASREYAKVVGTKPGKSRTGEAIERNVYEYERKFQIAKGEHNGSVGAWIERTK